MSDKLEIIADERTLQTASSTRAQAHSNVRSLAEIIIVFVLILVAIWTPQGPLNAFFSISAAACVVAFGIVGLWNPREMGLAEPLAGVVETLAIGALLCSLIWLLGVALRSAGPGYAIPWERSWQYAIWALVQQFILQSVFFVRFESLLGSRKAIFWSAALYAIAHIPSPALTLLSLAGGLVFCHLFRRYRNIFPLGVIHAALGLTIAASLPDKWLHHMRVGIGYLTLHQQ